MLSKYKKLRFFWKSAIFNKYKNVCLIKWNAWKALNKIEIIFKNLTYQNQQSFWIYFIKSLLFKDNWCSFELFCWLQRIQLQECWCFDEFLLLIISEKRFFIFYWEYFSFICIYKLIYWADLTPITEMHYLLYDCKKKLLWQNEDNLQLIDVGSKLRTKWR